MGTIKRGDVIVFKYPEEPERDFIKRVIGLPGETLEVQREEGLHQRHAARRAVRALPRAAAASPSEFHEVTSLDVRERYGPVTVPPNQYFVMGDNRDNSQDSRYWGFLPRDYIKGKALRHLLVVRSGARGLRDEGAGATLEGLGSVFVHFFTRTRWDRMLHQIR